MTKLRERINQINDRITRLASNISSLKDLEGNYDKINLLKLSKTQLISKVMHCYSNLIHQQDRIAELSWELKTTYSKLRLEIIKNDSLMNKRSLVTFKNLSMRNIR